MKKARNAGDPVEFLARLKAMTAADERGERVSSDVACNGCTSCCYYHEVDFDPSRERAEDLKHLDTVEAENGRVRLRKRADGACIHLGDTGCTVYEHRPRPCRFYDCRGMALVSVVESFDGGRRSPFWIFESHNQKGEMLKQGFQFLGMAHQFGAQKSGKGATAVDTFHFAMKNIDHYCAFAERLSKASPDERTKLLGVDPRSITEADFLESMKAMAAGARTVVSPEPE
jgi:hypothetical protein